MASPTLGDSKNRSHQEYFQALRSSLLFYSFLSLFFFSFFLLFYFPFFLLFIFGIHSTHDAALRMAECLPPSPLEVLSSSPRCSHRPSSHRPLSHRCSHRSFHVGLCLLDAPIDFRLDVVGDLPFSPLIPPNLFSTLSHFYFALPSYLPTAAPGPYQPMRLTPTFSASVSSQSFIRSLSHFSHP